MSVSVVNAVILVLILFFTLVILACNQYEDELFEANPDDYEIEYVDLGDVLEERGES